MEYIITFKNTNCAIRAEQFLLEQKLNVGVMPLPSKIRAGCGICLRIIPEEIKAALKTLAKMNIEEIGLYSRMPDNNRYIYAETSAVSAL